MKESEERKEKIEEIRRELGEIFNYYYSLVKQGRREKDLNEAQRSKYLRFAARARRNAINNLLKIYPEDRELILAAATPIRRKEVK